MAVSRKKAASMETALAMCEEAVITISMRRSRREGAPRDLVSKAII